jgi:hypothetical protein
LKRLFIPFCLILIALPLSSLYGFEYSPYITEAYTELPVPTVNIDYFTLEEGTIEIEAKKGTPIYRRVSPDARVILRGHVDAHIKSLTLSGVFYPITEQTGGVSYGGTHAVTKIPIVDSRFEIELPLLWPANHTFWLIDESWSNNEAEKSKLRRKLFPTLEKALYIQRIQIENYATDITMFDDSSYLKRNGLQISNPVTTDGKIHITGEIPDRVSDAEYQILVLPLGRNLTGAICPRSNETSPIRRYRNCEVPIKFAKSVGKFFNETIHLTAGPGVYQIEISEDPPSYQNLPRPPGYKELSHTFLAVNLDPLGGYHLRPSNQIPSNDKVFIELAGKITQGLRNEYDMSRAINKWISENIRYPQAKRGDQLGFTKREETPINTLTRGTGVCHARALMSLTLHRALGIPAVYLDVLSYDTSKEDFTVNHAITGIQIGNRWVIADPAGLFFFDQRDFRGVFYPPSVFEKREFNRKRYGNILHAIHAH